MTNRNNQFSTTRVTLHFTIPPNFWSLEVVDRSSETQLQVSENCIFLLIALGVYALFMHVYLLVKSLAC